MKISGVIGAVFAVCIGNAVVADGPSVTRSNVQSFLDRCNTGDGNACQALGDVFRNRDEAQDIGRRVDLDFSMQLYERGCALGDIGACGSMNRIYGDSSYHGYDPARALPYFEDRCTRRGPESNDCRRVEKLREDL